MSYKSNAKLGSLAVQVESDTLKGLFRELAFFGECPTECECGSKNIFPNHRVYNGNEFFEFRCGECGMSLSVGQNKDQVNLFINKAKGWQKYERQEA